MPLATTFWETFFLFLIFLPLLMIWAFALVDIFRRDDLSGIWKALWVVVIFLLPFLGTLIYLIVRPAGATKEERVALDQTNREFVARYAPTDTASQLQVLADLHDRGKLTDDEFAAEKARLLGAGDAPPATVS
jgi:Phospholipase_D-nuclease N-terminal/Short C-terminal domain